MDLETQTVSDADSKVSYFMRTHTVIPGDTLQTIAVEHYGDDSFAADLARANGIAVHGILTAGSEIKVPNKARLRRALTSRIAGVGDAASDMPEIVVTGNKPWYLQPSIWVAACVGFGVAYFALNYKKSKR